VRGWRYLLAGFALIAASTGVGPAATPPPPSDQIIRSIRLEVPQKGEAKGSWDPALSVLSGNIRGLYPDIRICVESPHVAGRCLPTCENADRVSENSGYVCEVSTGPNGILLEPTLYVLADDVDDMGGNERIAMFKVLVPDKCAPCTLDLPGGPLLVSVKTTPVKTYAGPYRGVVGTFSPDLPVVTPSSGAPAPAAPRTVREVLEQLLPDLRDADRCAGPDRGLFAGASLGAGMFRNGLKEALGPNAESEKIYQMALLASAFKDPVAREEVKRVMRTQGIEVDGPIWALAVGDLKYRSDIDDLAHDGVKYLVDMALDRAGTMALRNALPGLSRNELVREIELKMAARFSSTPAKQFLDEMFKRPGMTAECALNELGKLGMGDLIQIPR